MFFFISDPLLNPMSGYKYSFFHRGSLFFEHKIDGQHEEHGPKKVVQPQGFGLEKESRENGENQQCDHFLYDLELQESEGASRAFEAHPVGRDHKAVFKQGDAPADEDDSPQGHTLEKSEPQLAVPGQGHERVGDDQQQNSVYSFHFSILYSVGFKLLPMQACLYLRLLKLRGDRLRGIFQVTLADKRTKFFKSNNKPGR